MTLGETWYLISMLKKILPKANQTYQIDEDETRFLYDRSRWGSSLTPQKRMGALAFMKMIQVRQVLSEMQKVAESVQTLLTDLAGGVDRNRKGTEKDSFKSSSIYSVFFKIF